MFCLDNKPLLPGCIFLSTSRSKDFRKRIARYSAHGACRSGFNSCRQQPALHWS